MTCCRALPFALAGLSCCCRQRQEKGEEKGRYTKSQVGYISPIWGADPVQPISTKNGKVVGVHDVIIHSNFSFNIFRGFRCTGGQNFRVPIDLAGLRYNRAEATAQPVISVPVQNMCNHYAALCHHTDIRLTNKNEKIRNARSLSQAR